MSKSPEIQALLDALVGPTDENCCPTCKQPITPFRDKLSEKEFSISGMCQKCQDSVFGEPEPDDTDHFERTAAIFDIL